MKQLCTSIYTHKISRQLFKYGIVGCCAAVAQYIVVVILVHFSSLTPLWANPLGFFCGFLVSFFGHRFFTFHTSSRRTRALFLHFSLLAFCNFLLNQFLFFVFLKYFHIHYAIALPIVIAISTSIVFTLNKLWVFKT